MPCTATPFRKALAANSTAGDFAAIIPTAVEPVHSAATGIYDLFDRGIGVGISGLVPQYLLLAPYGGNASNDIFNMRVWGWTKTAGASPIWVPQLLVELACTLGSTDWSAGLGTNMKPVDTVVVTYGMTDEKLLGASIMAPANELPARSLVHLNGCQKIQFDFDMHTGGDSGNCLWRTLDCAA